jgi:hypothetical protein
MLITLELDPDRPKINVIASSSWIIDEALLVI